MKFKNGSVTSLNRGEMRFLITSYSTVFNKETVHVYDNIKNIIWTGAGMPLNLLFDPRFDYIRERREIEAKRDSQYPKKRNLKHLRIQMGVKCNFDCKYCAQRSYGRRIPIIPAAQSKVENFLSHLSSAVDSVEKIAITGGEALVYQKRLLPLVEGLKNLFPQVRLGMISNGSLLNVELADWLIDNRIRLTISHDGPSFRKYRDGEDIFDNPTVLAGMQRYVDRAEKEGLDLPLSFNIVITPENCQLSQLPAFFRAKTQRNVRLQFESIVKLNRDTENMVTPFTTETANILINEMLQAGIADTNPDINPLSFIGKLAENVVKRLASERNLNSILFPCDNVQEDTVAVDLDGNLLACQGMPAIRTGYGTLETLETATAKTLIPWTERSECNSCPFLVSCLGGCPVQYDEDHEITCRTLRLWHMGLFYVAWYRMFHSVIQRIDVIESTTPL